MDDVFFGLKAKVSQLRWISALECNTQPLILVRRAAESPAATGLAHLYSYLKATNRCSVTSLNASKLYKWPTFPSRHSDSSAPLKKDSSGITIKFNISTESYSVEFLNTWIWSNSFYKWFRNVFVSCACAGVFYVAMCILFSDSAWLSLEYKNT